MRSLAKIVERGHLVRGAKPVHWCFDCGSALAEAEIEYADKQIAGDRRRLRRARSARHWRNVFGAVVEDGVRVAMPIWTTTPWTLPASLAVSVGPDLDYVLVRRAERAGRNAPPAGARRRRSPARRWRVTAWTRVVALGHAKGSDLENVLLQHPFYAERDIPVLVGDHVSAEDGTGMVHTAPGHGQEDYAVGLKYGLTDRYSAAQLNPVDARGLYLPSTPPADGIVLAGLHIWKANEVLIDVIRASGHLLASHKLTHSYPHCWRHKTPVVFRATPQWFISMEQANLRADALREIGQVSWVPEWGEARIYNMIEGRPDWTHLAPALLGRADRTVLPSRDRRDRIRVRRS